MMPQVDRLVAELKGVAASRRGGSVRAADGASLTLGGLAPRARLGDLIEVERRGRGPLEGEIVALRDGMAVAMTYAPAEGVGLGDRAWLRSDPGLRPCDKWIGRMVDAFGRPIDGRPLAQGAAAIPLRRPAPQAATRRALGGRLATGQSALDTVLPLARGQRVGLFAGSGVGKSTLLAQLARDMETEVVVLALIGERGRELREFAENALGKEGRKRSVIVTATSDESPLVKRRAAWTAMAAAEHFRDQGKQVLLLFDSLTRFAEAHREIALTAGEPPSLRAHPPSTAHLIAALAERAGPGPSGPAGDITAVFTVLVAGSDMEEPIADMARGILDGHFILDREIAERGRFPAIDLRRSVSRVLPGVASPAENQLIREARRLTAAYESVLPMIQAGLFKTGADPEADAAVRVQPALDAFMAAPAPLGCEESFERLAKALSGARAGGAEGDA
ncbi:FliI/YscN family ATPase [Rhodovulum sp. DZ06]|uniref:FliI/YscN family ATPase n=1 Tax=Rhodovulum sp. DZ06 TaxID=3425126 RepID=UPI003D32EED1